MYVVQAEKQADDTVVRSMLVRVKFHGRAWATTAAALPVRLRKPAHTADVSDPVKKGLGIREAGLLNAAW